MFDCDLRRYCSIATIEYSDSFEGNWDLFNKGIDILKNYSCSDEFSHEERDILEDVFTIIELEELEG